MLGDRAEYVAAVDTLPVTDSKLNILVHKCWVGWRLTDRVQTFWIEVKFSQHSLSGKVPNLAAIGVISTLQGDIS